MRWLEREIWRIGFAIVAMLLLLLLLAWISVVAVGAREGAQESSGPVTVRVLATPTEDATVATLNKEKLAQEVKQLQEQNEPGVFVWLRMNASILLSTLVVVIGALIGLWRWLGDRRDEHEKRREDQRSEQEKRAEERFQSAVIGLGDEKEGSRIGAAILLRTFLRPGYEQFYTQTFDLAVAHLGLPRNPHPSQDPDTPLPLTTLSRALIIVFKEAFPLARSQNPGGSQSLDATGIQLDNAYLRGADLKQVWMPQASLRNADLSEADLSGAKLSESKLCGAKLNNANLRGAKLNEADFSEAELIRARLNEADLNMAYFSGARLSGADLSGADLRRAKLNEADLSWAKLNGAYLSEADLNGANLSEADLSGADLRGANLRGVVGLTKGQLENL